MTTPLCSVDNAGLSNIIPRQFRPVNEKWYAAVLSGARHVCWWEMDAVPRDQPEEPLSALDEIKSIPRRGGWKRIAGGVSPRTGVSR